jgi:hypothetical protein
VIFPSVEDAQADVDTFIANVDIGAGDEHPYVSLRLLAKGTSRELWR